MRSRNVLLRSRPLSIVAAATVLALVLTACGQQGAPQKAASDRSADSPLNSYLSGRWNQTQEEMQAEVDEQNRRFEELVATCMRKQGFEYTPDLQNGGVVIPGDGGEWHPENREWVEQYGYGAINWPGREESSSPQPMELTEEYGPNQPYMDSLSESELEAYGEALWGEQPTEAQYKDPDFDYSSLERGCQGDANDEVHGQSVWNDDQFKELTEALDKFYGHLGEAPGLAALDAEWSSCMADGGQPGFTKQQDAAQSIYEEWGRLQGWEITEGGMAATSPAVAEGDDGIPGDWVDPYTLPETKLLMEKELKLALVDLDCRVKTDYRNRQIDIQFAEEQKFVDAHKTELEAFKAASESKGK